VVEVYLLDMSADLYRTELSIEFHSRIRDEQRFDDVAEIAAQIQSDVEVARRELGDPA